MNEHAKKIWHSWVNGSHKTQYYSEVHSTWLDAYPNFMSEENQPQSKPDSWRIPTASGVRTSKPKLRVKTVRFRTALFDVEGDTFIPVNVFPGQYDSVENDQTFIEWIGDEILVKRSIEE